MATPDWLSIFREPVDKVQVVADDLWSLYQNFPVEFAEGLLDNIITIPPKTLRLICYELYTHGVDLKQILEYGSLRYNGSHAELDFLNYCQLVPAENWSTLLKYGFPPFLKLGAQDSGESLFFWKSYQKSLEDSSDLSWLSWLPWILDLCRFRNINLNLLNFGNLGPQQESQSLLEAAISQESLSHVQELLKYGVPPGDLADLVIQNFPEALNFTTMGLILRQLVRYGSTVSFESDPELGFYLKQEYPNLSNLDSLASRIYREIQAGKRLTPEYRPSLIYEKGDEDEDLAIVAKVHPDKLRDIQYAVLVPKLDLGQFEQTILAQNSETRVISGRVLTWPTWMDVSKRSRDKICPTNNPDLKVANPPNPQRVRELTQFTGSS